MVYSASALVALQKFDQPNLFLHQTGALDGARPGGARDRDADRLPHLPQRHLHLERARARHADAHRRDVQRAGQRDAALVRRRRPRHPAVGAGQDRRACCSPRSSLERRMHRIDDLRYSMLPIAIVVGGLAGLILLQPDFGTAMTLVLIVGAMVFAAGLNYRYLLGAALAAAPVIYLLLMRLRLSPPPAVRVLGSVGRSAGRRLPDHPVAARGRIRRRLRARPDVGRAEAVLPARAAHRLHLRGDRRGAGADRRHLHPGVLLRHRLARPADRVAGAQMPSAPSSPSASPR